MSRLILSLAAVALAAGVAIFGTSIFGISIFGGSRLASAIFGVASTSITGAGGGAASPDGLTFSCLPM